MPFKSQAQRGLMHAVMADPAVAEHTGVGKDVASKFIEHDPGGKLPTHAKPKRKSQFSLPKQRRGKKEEAEPAAMHRREGKAGERAEGE